jgi:hypothetical protein
VKESTLRKVEKRKCNSVYCTSCGVAKPAKELHLRRGLPVCDKCLRRIQEKRKIYNVEWREKNAYKAKAHSIIARALRKGELTKPKECQMCGREEYLYSHHWDYSKPLLVTWVCISCHNTLGAIKEEHLKEFLPIIEKFKNGRRPLGKYKEFLETYNRAFEESYNKRTLGETHDSPEFS